MDDITYKEVRENQERIVKYKREIENIIGYIDENGSRKIKPEHFLSGEVAAYKFLVSWDKRMRQGEQVITKKVIEILDTIECIIHWSSKGDFVKQETIDNYEALSTDLWIDLLEDRNNAPSYEFNSLVIAIAATSLAEKGVSDSDNDYLNYDYNDMLDGLALGEAFSIAHEWLLSKPRDIYVKLVEDTELYKFHFNLLN